MFKTNNLYQNDPVWKNTPLGFPTDGGTIGSWGCLLTSITMMLNGAGYTETPPTVNDKMKQRGGFQGAMIIPSLVPAVFPRVLYKTFVNSENSPAPIDLIDRALSQGKPVIVEVDWSAASGIQTHWVLLKEKKGGDYVIYDPYQYPGDSPEKEVHLLQRYKYSGGELDTTILGAFFFELVSAPAEPVIKPLPANPLTVYTSEDSLALRAAGAFDGALIKRLALGTALLCLDAPSAAALKVGQPGQWINVQDPSGTQGFVAGWYLAAQAPAPEPAPGPVTGGLVLVPTVDGLALRSQMLVSDATLIKRLPLTERLSVREPVEQATAKIGVQNQWIKVSDSANVEGYVAAWYVQKSEPGGTATPPPPVTPPVSSQTVKVRAAVDLLALRSQPVISDATLLKRLPIGSSLALVRDSDASKIGVSGQWLAVIDQTGTQGWVAAWYVSR